MAQVVVVKKVEPEIILTLSREEAQVLEILLRGEKWPTQERNSEALDRIWTALDDTEVLNDTAKDF